MQLRRCGESDIEVSVLGIGVWSFGGRGDDYWGTQDQREAEAVVAEALDRGVNYFDTAEMYNDGRSEEAFGRALGSRRGEAVIGTKISPQNCSPEGVFEHCEASLRRLGTDYVDIYMVHWPLQDYPAADVFAALGELQAAGKIRSVGVSNFGPAQLTEAMAAGVRIDANQVNYSLLARAIEPEILPFCREHHVGVLCYCPLMQGLLTGKYRSIDEMPPQRTRTRHFRGDREGSRHGQAGAEELTWRCVEGIGELAEEHAVPMAQLALAWCMAGEGVTSVISGVRNVAQLGQNAGAVGVEIDGELMGRLDELTRPLMAALGDSPDYWEADGRGRTH